MADIKKISVNNTEYDIKDETARSYIGDLASLTTEEQTNLVAAINEVKGAVDNAGAACGITYIESTDTENLTAIRDLDSGTYVFYGRFKPFSASTSTLTFSSKLLVNVVKQTSASQVMVFYPVNNCVQYLKVTDDSYERKNVYLNDLLAAVGTLSDLSTTDKTSLVAAINEVVTSVSGHSTKIEMLLTSMAEVAEDVGDVENLTTDDKTSLVAAVNEVQAEVNSAATAASENAGKIGTLTDLATTDQSSLVAAVNEIKASLGDIDAALDALNGEVV